jgi:hypothetical protein
VARFECSLQPIAGEIGMRQEVDIRHVVTSLGAALANSEFATIRERLIKIGARAIEHITRIRI